MKERWRWVVGYEGLYKVTSFGRVYGMKRHKFLTPVPGKYGHLWVGLWRDNKYKAKFVSRLVLEAFVGPCPDGMEACHFPDRTPSNNHLNNLRWGTGVENAADRETHGNTVKGEKFWSAKMTEWKVRRMRQLYETGRYTIRKLGKKFGISQTSARQAIRLMTWKHIL
jgi:hypothetical protein